jgi:hypothetical protein
MCSIPLLTFASTVAQTCKNVTCLATMLYRLHRTTLIETIGDGRRRKKKADEKRGAAVKPNAPVLQSRSQTFRVDIPTEDCIDNDSGAWHNVGEFASEVAALEFAQSRAQTWVQTR